MSQEQANNENSEAAEEELIVEGGPASTLEADAASGDVDLPEDAEGAEVAEEALDLTLVKRVLETALLTSPEPLTLNDMKRMFARGATNNELMRKLLAELRTDWDGRGVELVNVASGWRFRSRPEYQRYLDKLYPQKAPKYSRAVMETLTIIAYRQPVTRGDIEDIRGVVVTTNVIKALEARGWIDVIGHREVPGRPAIYATTKQFLDDLNLRSLEELPPLDDLGALVEHSGAAQLEMAMPSRDSAADEADTPAVSISMGEGLIEDFDDDVEPVAANTGGAEDAPPPGAQLH
jgi:segregation and condensation protein B